MTLDDMLKTPGFYLIGQTGSPFKTRVEVDSALVCHQLDSSGDRDGVLPRDGWREARGFDIETITK